jgi:hypothetical protein
MKFSAVSPKLVALRPALFGSVLRLCFPRTVSRLLGILLLSIVWLWQPGQQVQAHSRLIINASAEEALTMPEAKVGSAYEYQFQTEGGLAPLKWSIVAGILPPGLKLEEDGKLSGIPTQAKAQAYAFVVEVADSARVPQRFSLPCLLLVNAAPLRIVTGAPKLRIVTSGNNQSGGQFGGAPPETEAREPKDELRAELNDNPGNETDSRTARADKATLMGGRLAGNNAAPQQEAILGFPRARGLATSGRAEARAPIVTAAPLSVNSSVTVASAQNKRLDQPAAEKPVTGTDEPNKTVQLFLNKEESPVKLKIADGKEDTKITTAADGSFKAEPVHPLAEGQRVALNIGGVKSLLYYVQGERDDERENFEASFYSGLGIDTFAAGQFKRVLNRNDPSVNDITGRYVGGFDFAYRLFGDPRGNGKWQKGNQQLWVYGETVHGVRSADVNCKAENAPPVCDQFNVNNNPTNSFVYILRNATSLEGHMGIRWEFATLNKNLLSSARAYFKAQAGFLSVTDAGDDAFDMHHIALGVIATKGRFQNSYLEVGWGRTDLFLENKRRRFKVDGYLSWDFGHKIFDWLRPFAQITVDSDLGRGSDSIQTYIGFDFNLKCLFNPVGCRQ